MIVVVGMATSPSAATAVIVGGVIVGVDSDGDVGVVECDCGGDDAFLLLVSTSLVIVGDRTDVVAVVDGVVPPIDVVGVDFGVDSDIVVGVIVMLCVVVDSVGVGCVNNVVVGSIVVVVVVAFP